jgi:hypothetical protein
MEASGAQEEPAHVRATATTPTSLSSSAASTSLHTRLVSAQDAHRNAVKAKRRVATNDGTASEGWQKVKVGIQRRPRVKPHGNGPPPMAQKPPAVDAPSSPPSPPRAEGEGEGDGGAGTKQAGLGDRIPGRQVEKLEISNGSGSHRAEQESQQPGNGNGEALTPKAAARARAKARAVKRA